MKIFVFSSTKGIEKLFPVLKKTSPESYTFFAAKEFLKKLKEIPSGSLIYLDVSAYDVKTLNKNLGAIIKRNSLSAGIIDPKGSISDPAMLFHSGACDYIGKDLFRKKFDAKRFIAAARFSDMNHESTGDLTIADAVPLSGMDWKTVRSGKEYKFCFLFIELDRQKEIKSSQFGGQNKNPADMFRKYVETQLKGSGGKIWMWMDHGGLILFPFNGTTCSGIAPMLKLILNRVIFEVDESIFNEMLSFRTALHIGSTVYRDRGDTGKIVSDSINFIFHLGQKRAEPGSVYITEDILSILPATLVPLFQPKDEYEGRKIFCMKRLLDKA